MPADCYMLHALATMAFLRSAPSKNDALLLLLQYQLPSEQAHRFSQQASPLTSLTNDFTFARVSVSKEICTVFILVTSFCMWKCRKNVRYVLSVASDIL